MKRIGSIENIAGMSVISAQKTSTREDKETTGAALVLMDGDGDIHSIMISQGFEAGTMKISECFEVLSDSEMFKSIVLNQPAQARSGTDR